jgi:ubiquinone/menaquinone biosynthesis C-methylase UbiE
MKAELRHTFFFLLGAGRTVGMLLLDVATGVGIAAEAAADVVGPTGHVTAIDFSPAM